MTDYTTIINLIIDTAPLIATSGLVTKLYSTISKDDIMENKNRKNIVALIDSNHGITFTAMMDELGLKNGNLAYHLYTLERRRYIKSVRDGKFRRFYPRRAGINSELNFTENNIISIIKDNPDIYQSDIAGILGVSTQAAGSHIINLERKGFINRIKKGNRNYCNINSNQ
jgi:predicted transcriptional regulator